MSADDEMREFNYGQADPLSVLFASMVEAETKAWEALSGYKFWMFGYHAARWVNYNQLLPRNHRLRNPFANLVKFGRDMADKKQGELPTLQAQLPLLRLGPRE
jgi:hypothetical protein